MINKKQFAVLGLGRFGRSIARTLSENGAEVLAVDNDMELVQDISEYVTHAVMADITDETDLRNLGLGNFDVVIIATGSHLESSVLAVLLAKEMGVPYVIAKALDENHKKIHARSVKLCWLFVTGLAPLMKKIFIMNSVSF